MQLFENQIVLASGYLVTFSSFFTVTRDQSVGGSYLGCEPMGLFWGLQVAPGGGKGLRQVTTKN